MLPPQRRFSLDLFVRNHDLPATPTDDVRHCCRPAQNLHPTESWSRDDIKGGHDGGRPLQQGLATVARGQPWRGRLDQLPDAGGTGLEVPATAVPDFFAFIAAGDGRADCHPPC